MEWTKYVNHACEPNVAFVIREGERRGAPRRRHSNDYNVADTFWSHELRKLMDEYPGGTPEEISLYSVKDILPGEQLRFNYAQTEYEDPDLFECNCGSPKCYGTYHGFAYLNQEQKESLRPLLTPFLRYVLDVQMPKQ